MTSDTRHHQTPRWAGAVAALAAALVIGLAAPTVAQADATEELQQAQAAVQESIAAYDEAVAYVEQIQADITANEERIAQLEEELPEMRERAAESMRTLYRMQQGSSGLIELMLSADSFFDLITTIQYLEFIQSHNTDALESLISLSNELEETKAELDEQLAEAEEALAEADEALEAAEEAYAQLQAQIEAQAEAEEAERLAAIAAAEEALEEDDEDTTFVTETGNEASVETPTTSDPTTVDPGSDKDAFIAEWGARIDSYLAGSPMAGLGEVFAEAAWTYGVDPRFSPAIAMVESTLGRYCFLPYNAWGWGSSSWSSWEEAIWAHVRGLAVGYGGQLTYAGAKKYCPSNADYWYSSVLANMERI